MIRKFLIYTAVIEAITGIGLLFIPVPVISLLFGSPLTGNNGIIAAMIAGAAIFSLALLAWLLRNKLDAFLAVIALLIYNILLTLIFLLGAVKYELSGPGFWLVIIFHFFQSIIGLVVLQQEKK